MDNIFKDYFDISESEMTFDVALKDEGLTQERINELMKYQMLFLPIKKYRDKEGYFFHSGTRDFYLYCKMESPENNFDFITEKSEFKELSLNSAELYLGTFLIKNIALPIFIGLIVNYIDKKLTSKEDKVIINIIIQNEESNKSNEISFRGTKDDFNQRIVSTLQTYSKVGKMKIPEQKGERINVLS